MKSIQRILLATDFSASADAAADVAARLAEQLHAMVDVVTVVDRSGWTDVSSDPAFHRQGIGEICEEARKRARTFADRHFAEIEDVRVHVRDGEHVVKEILHAAENLKSDLIVMGTHGTKGLAHLIIGSVAETVVRTSPIPVVTVRGLP